MSKEEWLNLIRVGGRTLVGLAIVLSWLYAEANQLPSAAQLRELAIPILAGLFVFDGAIRILNGRK